MLTIRPRRLRKNPIIREMVAETRLSKHQFIYPYFVIPGSKNRQAIEAMPGIRIFGPQGERLQQRWPGFDHFA